MKLREYLFRYEIPVSTFAKEFAINACYMRMINRGEKKAGRQLAREIEIYTGGQVTYKDLRGREELEEE